MSAVLTIAGRELRDSLRNRWIVATTALMAALAISLAFLGSAPTGSVAASPLSVVVISLATLSVLLVPLIALLLSYDGIVGEIERGTMVLLLSYPLARWQVVAGKFCGFVAVLVVATLVGYGGAGLVTGWLSESVGHTDWIAFAALIGATVLLGAVFVAIGLMISALVRERATAAGLAIAVWLVLVVLFDLALLGAVVVDRGETLSATLFNYLMLLNPTDAYRMLNLAGFEDVRGLSGMVGLNAESGHEPAILLAMLGAWVLVPLLVALRRFGSREL